MGGLGWHDKNYILTAHVQTYIVWQNVLYLNSFEALSVSCRPQCSDQHIANCMLMLDSYFVLKSIYKNAFWLTDWLKHANKTIF